MGVCLQHLAASAVLRSRTPAQLRQLPQQPVTLLVLRRAAARAQRGDARTAQRAQAGAGAALAKTPARQHRARQPRQRRGASSSSTAARHAACGRPRRRSWQRMMRRRRSRQRRRRAPRAQAPPRRRPRREARRAAAAARRQPLNLRLHLATSRRRLCAASRRAQRLIRLPVGLRRLQTAPRTAWRAALQACARAHAARQKRRTPRTAERERRQRPGGAMVPSFVHAPGLSPFAPARRARAAQQAAAHRRRRRRFLRRRLRRANRRPDAAASSAQAPRRCRGSRGASRGRPAEESSWSRHVPQPQERSSGGCGSASGGGACLGGWTRLGAPRPRRAGRASCELQAWRGGGA